MSKLIFFAILLFLAISCAEKKTEYQTIVGFYTPEKEKKISIVSKLKENDSLPVEERIALYHFLKKNKFDTYDFSNETELTLYGYSFLWNNNLKDAIAIFDLIVTEFPNSSNAYDSLGEAKLQAGDSIIALENYEKSLQLNPDNFHAEDVIESIKNPNLKPLTAFEKFSRKYSKEMYLQDLDQLGRKLLDVHPNALRFITKESFFKNIEAKKALITEQTTYGEFAWHCSSIIASINCSHTSASTMGNPYTEIDMLPNSKKFPIHTRWVKNQLFVIDPLSNADKVNIKDEILSINGVKVSDLLTEIQSHIPAQGSNKTNKIQYFNTWAAVLIPYSLSFPEKFNINVKGKSKSIELRPLVKFENPPFDESINICSDKLCFEQVDKNTAIISIASFNFYEWDSFPVFKSFLDSTMHIIQQKGIDNLIFDLRFNSGGSQYPSIYLLQYLVNEPFTYFSKADFEGKIEKIYGEETIHPHPNRFKGKSYFLIDGNGTSTTGHFMSLVKSLKLGVIIGEELGSNQFCSAGQTLCRLKNTKFEFSVANNTHISTATNLPDAVGILPDYEVIQTIDQYFLKQDVVKEFALKLIKSKP